MVAAEYLKQVNKDFETYAEANYLPAVKAHEPKALNLLAGLRYVQSRDIPKYDKRLKELFTTRRNGNVAREVDKAVYTLVDRATMSRTDGALVRFTINLGKRQETLEEADERFRSLATELLPRLDAFLPGRGV